MKLFEDKIFYTHMNGGAFKGITSWEKIPLIGKITFIILNPQETWNGLRKIYK